MEQVACDLCGADDAAPVLARDPWRVVRCRACGLVYLNPRPAPKEIAGDYDWFRHAPLQTASRRRKESGLRRLLRALRGKGLLRRQPREHVVLGRIREYVAGGRFLDVGCGDGSILVALSEAGYEVCGIDISEVAQAEARRRGCEAVQLATIHEAEFSPAGFDAVLMMSYLEHEPHPRAALSRVRELLKPGGHLFIKVPHYGSWNRKLLGLRWSGYFFPQHLYYFKPRTLARLVEACDLEVVRNNFWDHVPVSDVFWLTARRPVG